MAPDNKVVWAEIGSDATNARILAHYNDTKNKPKVQFPTRMAPKKENHPMMKAKKVALCYQGSSCLCHK